MATIINASTSAGLIQTADTSGSLALQTSGTTAVTIDTSQNVGIGTSSPVTRLTVYKAATSTFTGTALGALVITDSTNTLNYYSNIDFNTTGASTTPIARIGMQYTSNGSYLSFGTSNSYASGITNTAMTIDYSGNLLVGTTSTFDNVSFLKVQSLGGVSTKIAGTSLTSQMSFFNDNGRVGYIGTSGSTTSYNTSSDYRLKENIAPMTGALAKVVALKPVTYTWKANGSDGQGFIAHELQAVVPDCVTGEKDAVDADGNPIYQGVDTSFLVATLTAALQEAHGLIKDLQVRVNALEAK